jgi:DNA-binding ferritin-like protein
MNQESRRTKEITGAVVGAYAFNTLAVLEELLTLSTRLGYLHSNARWQIAGAHFSEIRRVLNNHHKEQLGLIGMLVDRIRILGGAARVFASDFLERDPICRVIRGPGPLNALLLDLLEAHEAVLSVARPHESYTDLHWVRELVVGHVVLTNEKQWDCINQTLSSSRPQQRPLETFVGLEGSE